jgi:aspartate/methionine/tyrosine aminotransferase
MKAVNSLLANTGTTIFTVMSALAQKHQAINLGQGFPDTDGPQDIIEAAVAALRDGRNQYPPLTGVAELRAAVAAANQRFYGLTLDPDREVVVTSGATEAITACLMALLDPGDEVVLIEPLYDTYLPVVRMLGAVPKLVRLAPPDWALPRESLAAAFGPKTKAILLNSPMNPIGKVFTPEELGFIADLLQKHDAYAICDEVYEHLVFDGLRHIPLMTLPGMGERSLRIGSAGKTFSLTGWKIGYISGPAALMGVVAKAHQNLTFTTPPNLQRAVAVGLAKDDAYFAGLSADLQSKRDHLVAGLRRAGFRPLPSQGSYFVLADYAALDADGDDAAFCMRLAEEAGVVAIPLSAFYAGEKPRHHIRFAFCKREALLDEAIARLTRYFAAGQARASLPLTAAE